MRLGARKLLDDVAVGEEEDAVGDRRRAGVVSDHHRRLACFLDCQAKQFEDLTARLRVEVAGRLVREDDRRLGDERAGNRDALLLSAGELGRPVLPDP